MSVTLDDVRLARKRAYDRVDYWLQKYRGMTIHEAGISIPRIPKDLHPSEYGEWFDYFESFTGAQEEGGTQDYLEGENEPPELNPEYHNEPEPIDIEFPDEPEPPEPAEDDFDSDDVSKIIDDTLNGDYPDKEWYDRYKEDDTAPNYFTTVDEIINRGYEYGSTIGEAFEEAMNNIMNVLRVEDEEEFAKSLGNMDDVFSEFEKAKAYLSKLQEENSNNMSSKLFKNGMDHLNRALSKLYKKVGLLYTRGI